MQYMHEKHFTLDEARELLPWVDNIIKQMRNLFRVLAEIGFDVFQGRWTPKGNGRSQGPPPDEYNDFIELFKDLDSKGILVKDFREGLVDFPHIRPDGTEVYLCWLAGEEDIMFWHTIPDGFAGRRPIEEE